MKRLFLLGILFSVVAHSEAYVSFEKGPKSTTLWVPDGQLRAYFSGNELYTTCTSNAPAMCRGFIAGVADVIQNQNGNLLCIAQGATVSEITDVVIKYLRDNPAERHYAAFSTVRVALEKAYTCKAPGESL